MEGGVALCRQHDRFDGQGHLRNPATSGHSADLQREELHRAHRCSKKASNSILSFLELSRKLKQDGSDADLVEAVGKAAQALENDPDAGMALDTASTIDHFEAKMKEAAKKPTSKKPLTCVTGLEQLRQKMAGSA